MRYYIKKNQLGNHLDQYQGLLKMGGKVRHVSKLSDSEGKGMKMPNLDVNLVLHSVLD